MAKAAISRKYTLSASGILDIVDDIIYVENPDTGEMVSLKDLLGDFVDKSVKININYDEDYEVNND